MGSPTGEIPEDPMLLDLQRFSGVMLGLGFVKVVKGNSSKKLADFRRGIVVNREQRKKEVEM